MTITVDDTVLTTWFERDRAHVCLSSKESDETIIEWWDEAVGEAVEDGFLSAKDWHGTAVDYANQMGLSLTSEGLSIKPTVYEFLALHPERGFCIGYTRGKGVLEWSSDDCPNIEQRKVLVFDSKEEFDEFFEDLREGFKDELELAKGNSGETDEILKSFNQNGLDVEIEMFEIIRDDEKILTVGQLIEDGLIEGKNKFKV